MTNAFKLFDHFFPVWLQSFHARKGFTVSVADIPCILELSCSFRPCKNSFHTLLFYCWCRPGIFHLTGVICPPGFLLSSSGWESQKVHKAHMFRVSISWHFPVSTDIAVPAPCKDRWPLFFHVQSNIASHSIMLLEDNPLSMCSSFAGFSRLAFAWCSRTSFMAFRVLL